MKNIILCADDYGQNASISQAIIQLAASRRLSAVSCLMNFSGWPDAAKNLLPHKDNVAIGLHFNLTQGNPLSTELKKMFSLNALLIKSQLRLVSKKIIKAELLAQLRAFMTAFGTRPDFIDGHQHVHQFPVVRDALLEVYDEVLRGEGVYIRSTYNRSPLSKVSYLKQFILARCGGYQLQKLLDEKNISHNSSFSGIYDFSNKVPYENLFEKFVEHVSNDGLIMCHPGNTSTEILDDEIYHSRPNEFAYFSSDTFQNLLQSREINLIKTPKII